MEATWKGYVRLHSNWCRSSSCDEPSWVKLHFRACVSLRVIQQYEMFVGARRWNKRGVGVVLCGLYLQWTMRTIRLLTVGGTPLEAMQRYGPMCRRVTRVISSSGPSMLATAATNHIYMNAQTKANYSTELSNELKHGPKVVINYSFASVRKKICLKRYWTILGHFEE